jgi:hypothetical protein
MSDEMKVAYFGRDGREDKAYVSELTGEGVNSYTFQPIRVQFDDATESYIQTDDWEWNFDGDNWTKIGGTK